MLCQTYQQNQYAGNSCSMGVHICAMVVRDIGHDRGTKQPACSMGWTSRQPSKRAGDSKKTNVDGSQLLAWMTAVNQQWGKSRLQKLYSTLIM